MASPVWGIDPAALIGMVKFNEIKIKFDLAKIPVVVLSADAIKSQINLLLDKGADRFI